MKIEKETVISHYKILSEIGKGGMGEVYLAQDTKLNRKVAIKFLNEEFSTDADKLDRFVQEAQSVSALNHPHILTIYEIGEVDGTQYIATELIEGKTLREHIEGDDMSLVETLKKEGVTILDTIESYDYGKFVHILDIEGNKIELWEPAD